jgi:S-adenosylmethionine-diacylgycerolhomoserine-N-methlytransferase
MTANGATSDAATAMDRMYRWQRHVYDLTRKYYLLGRDRLIARLDADPGMTVLEIGCGTARNLVVAARCYPGVRCYGIDVSQAMLHSARRRIARSGLGHRIMVAQADATTFDPAAMFGRPRFERVFISYSLSMIPQWRAVADHAASLLSPGGELHIVDFGTQEQLPAWARAALRLWLARFDVIPRDGLAAQLELSAAQSGAELFVERPYRGYAQYAVLRRFTVAAIAPSAAA